MLNKVFSVFIVFLSIIKATDANSSEVENIVNEKEELIKSQFIRPPEDEEETYGRSLELNFNICIPYTKEKDLKRVITKGLEGFGKEFFDFGKTYIFSYEINGKTITDCYGEPVCKYGMYENLEKANEDKDKLKKIFSDVLLSISPPAEIKNADLQNFSKWIIYMPVKIYNDVYNEQE